MSMLLDLLPNWYPCRKGETISGVGRLLRRGEVTCVGILEACLAQIDRWEPQVQAWATLDREGAMEQARALDEERRSGEDRGPLHGIPVGIKDIFDVMGLPTACGSRRWAGRIARRDARIVTDLREAGAVILGKTVTTPYAWIDPPPTRNPSDLERTPGGSSSGSAAAVATGMCYGAIGSQTGGSITRPASFCGVTGMKPSRLLELHQGGGALPLARSLDHFGLIARTIEDLRLIFHAICTGASSRNVGPPAGDVRRRHPPRLVRFRGFFDRRMEPRVRHFFEFAIEALDRRSATVISVDDPVDFEGVLRDHRRVMAAEAAALHSEWLDAAPDDYPPRITELVNEGRALSAPAYLQAKAQQDRVKTALMNILIYQDFDAAITPATVGAVPDRSTTGDPAFNSPWSFCGLPTVSFPIGLDIDHMPIAAPGRRPGPARYGLAAHGGMVPGQHPL